MAIDLPLFFHLAKPWLWSTTYKSCLLTTHHYAGLLTWRNLSDSHLHSFLTIAKTFLSIKHQLRKVDDCLSSLRHHWISEWKVWLLYVCLRTNVASPLWAKSEVKGENWRTWQHRPTRNLWTLEAGVKQILAFVVSCRQTGNYLSFWNPLQH